jgi:hypothetical protein
VQGYVNPKYIVVGVTYAPPGPASFVQYQKSQFVGTTESLAKSFGSGTTSSVAISYPLGQIPLVSNGKITDTYSTTSSQTTTNTSTLTLSFESETGEQTYGTGNAFAPVDNDYDTIWVWLNPVTIFTVAGTSVAWNGYGADSTDENGMDVVGVELGYLNGDFGSMPPDLLTSLNRSWAASQIWPSGQGPALTSSDYAQIASADPFSANTYGPEYIGYVPPSPTTSDNRFTVSVCTSSESINYVQAGPSTTPPPFTCTLTYTNTSIQAQDIQTQSSQTFSVAVAFSGTGFLKNLDADLENSNTLTWSTDEQSSITQTTTSTASLSIQGPACNNVIQGVGPCVPVYDASNNQPVQFDVYQDNMYGTFMFAPIHYY